MDHWAEAVREDGLVDKKIQFPTSTKHNEAAFLLETFPKDEAAVL